MRDGCLSGSARGTTQSPYIVVPDADEVYRLAQAAGAEVITEIRTSTTADPSSRVVIPRISLERRYLSPVARNVLTANGRD